MKVSKLVTLDTEIISLLAKEDNASGLINALLHQYYDGAGKEISEKIVELKKKQKEISKKMREFKQLYREKQQKEAKILKVVAYDKRIREKKARVAREKGIAIWDVTDDMVK